MTKLYNKYSNSYFINKIQLFCVKKIINLNSYISQSISLYKITLDENPNQHHVHRDHVHIPKEKIN